MTNQTINIAVVDDSVAIVDLTCSSLKRDCKKRYPKISTNIHGYTSSSDFEQGMIEHDYDLILMDYNLNVFNGVEVMQRVQDNFPRVQCIYIVSNPQNIPEKAFQLHSTIGVVKKHETMFNNIASAVFAIWSLKTLKRQRTFYMRLAIALSMLVAFLILIILYMHSS